MKAAKAFLVNCCLLPVANGIARSAIPIYYYLIGGIFIKFTQRVSLDSMVLLNVRHGENCICPVSKSSNLLKRFNGIRH